MIFLGGVEEDRAAEVTKEEIEEYWHFLDLNFSTPVMQQALR